MRFMTSEQEEIMDKLLRLANGDVGLVEEAFSNAATEPGKPPTLDAIVDYIMERRGFTDFVTRSRRQSPESATSPYV